MLSRVHLLLIVAGSLLLSALPAASEEVVYRIYFNHDKTTDPVSNRSVEAGLRAALHSDDLQDIDPGKQIKFEFKVLNHRTNIYRTKQHLDRFINDEKAFLFVGGYYSPPLIRYRDFINANQVLTFAPWSAGGPITRPKGFENWIFRLSVDDRKAGAAIAEYAMRVRQCRQTHLFLVDNPWGRSNAKSLRAGLAVHGGRPTSEQWMPWGMTPDQARKKLSILDTSASDCILLVGGEALSLALMEALLDVPFADRPTVLSHWGLAKGGFEHQISFQERESVGLRFIQSCHDLFVDRPILRQAMSRLAFIGGGEPWATQKIPSAPGFVHAYDMGRLLLAAMRQANLSGDARIDRERVRDALEALKRPVEGLLKTYVRPFSPYSPSEPDAHEALSRQDLCMARFDEEDVIRTIPVINRGARG